MKDNSEIKVVRNCIDIADCSYKSNTHIKTLIICNGVISIGREAFAECKNLKKIFLPESIKHIEATAFKDSGVLLSVSKNDLLQRTLIVYCKERSYVDFWLQDKKTGYIKVYI